MVLLDGGSSWSAPGRAALLEPPAVASVAAAARCAGPLPSVGREAIRRRLASNYICLWARRSAGNRAGRCGAARHVPGRSREEHHHSLLTVLEQCRRTRSLGAARPPARPGGGKATDGTRLVCIPPASRSPGSISVVVVVGDVGLAQLAELTLSWVAVERCRGGTEVSARGARAGAPQV